MDDRASTMAVLMDIGAARRETDEKIAALGELAVSQSDLPNGLKPHLLPYSSEAIRQLIVNPTWANTLYASVVATIATPPGEEGSLREYLVQVASTAVNWIEVLDQRKESK